MPGPRGPRGFTDKKIDMNSLKRLLRYLFRRYKWHLGIVVVCILANSYSNTIANTFMANVIDEVITPGLISGFDAVKGRLGEIIGLMIIFDLIAVVCAIIYP
ncbi:MAG: hypothetical protein II712_03190, partial [Erysipelotrichaceae bacterium]|nr:hypothetical protein [Erysipelotrichaceae bacterium]